MQATNKRQQPNSEVSQPESIIHIFHCVNRLIPDEQDVLQIRPDMRVADALALMRDKSYSQLPVTEGHDVLGFFSYRSLALSLPSLDVPAKEFGDMRVIEFLEEPFYVTIQTELASLVEELDRTDAVVVGRPDLLQAILTPMDVLRYLLDVTNAFVLLGVIELALRALIRRSVKTEELAACISSSLSYYSDEKRPKCLEDFTFDDYISILRDGRNWPRFQPVFGSSRKLVRARLEPIRNIRNDVFHFKKPEKGISIEEHEKLVVCRNWLLLRARLHEAKSRGTDGI